MPGGFFPGPGGGGGTTDHAALTNRGLADAHDIPSITGLTGALAGKIATTALGAANGVMQLGADGKALAGQLPSYVDDVLEFANLVSFPGTGETGKIYVALADNKQYRWSGSVYVELVPSPGSTDNVPEGATNQYHTAARVRGVALTGLSTASGADVVATDTVLDGIGKFQAKFLAFAASVRAAVLTGLSTATNAAVVATDTVLDAIGKLQAQVSARAILGDLPINNQTGPTYTIALTDVGARVDRNNAAPHDTFLPLNASVPIPLNRSGSISRGGAAGVATIRGEGAVQLLIPGGGSTLELGPYEQARWIKSGTDVYRLHLDSSRPSGVPAGGTTGQALKKASATDFDATWQDDATGGGGGTSAGIPMQIDAASQANTDPGQGKIRFSSASQATASQTLRIDDADRSGTSIGALKTSASGNIVYLVSEPTPTKYQSWFVSSITDASGYDNHTSQLVAKGGADFANDELVRLLILPGLISGLGAPVATLGVDGQRYIDATYGAAYRKVGAAWAPIANGSNWADKPLASAVPAGLVWTVWDLNSAQYESDGSDWLLSEGMREVCTLVGPFHAWDDGATAQTVASFALPAAAPGPRDEIEMYGLWVHHNSATGKSAAIRLDNGDRAGYTGATTTGSAHTIARMRNRNSRASQVATPATGIFALTMSATAQRSAINFGSAQTFAWNGTHPANNTLNVSTFTSMARSANVVTAVIAANPNLSQGGYIRLQNNTDAGAGTPFNGTFLLTSVTGAGPYTVTWAQAGADRTAATLDGTLNRGITLEQGGLRLVRGSPT